MTTSRHRTLVVLAGVLLVGGACSTGDGAAEPTPVTTSATAPTSSSATTASSSATTTTPATTTPASTASPQNEPLLVGAEPVIQLTATEGVGIRPTLAWESVDGAASYFLVVKDESEVAYWAWDGSETSVPLGGAEFPADFGNGPSIGPGYTWSVSAYAGDGTFLAISGDRPVSP